jgi:DNA repair exonuclease SbcCD nuclease subunit
MKILIFADLHAHPFGPYSTILENGMNSRLNDAVNCLEQMFTYAKSNSIDMVWFAGDMFHTRKTITVQAHKAVYDVLDKFHTHRISVIMLHGNHDQADRSGNDHSLHSFREITKVVDKPTWLHVGGYDVDQAFLCAVPYVEDVSAIKELINKKFAGCDTDIPRFFLGHFGITGAKLGADFVYENPHDASVDDLNTHIFEAGFLGHFHLPQQVGTNFWYVGAPLQHTWGDVGQTRGFSVYDTLTKQYTTHELKAPKFVRLNNATECVESPDNYVQLYDKRIWSEDEKEAFKKKLKARSFEVLPILKDKNIESLPRIDFKPGMAYPDIIKMYVSSGVQSTEDLDNAYLTKLGTELLLESDKV